MNCFKGMWYVSHPQTFLIQAQLYNRVTHGGIILKRYQSRQCHGRALESAPCLPWFTIQVHITQSTVLNSAKWILRTISCI